MTRADELAEAVEHLRERLDTCKRGFGDVPQSLTDHAVEIVLGELERRGTIERRAAIVAGEGCPALSGDPSPQQAAVTARYILTGESR